MEITFDEGHLWIDCDNILHYLSATFGEWNVPVADIKVIGESTNQDGPLLPDWFIVFVVDSTGWFEVSKSAKGVQECLSKLSEECGSSLSPGLFASTDFDSRTLWPESVIDMPLFEYYFPPSKHIFGKIAQWCGFTEIHQKLSPAVLDFLKEVGNEDVSIP